MLMIHLLHIKPHPPYFHTSAPPHENNTCTDGSENTLQIVSERTRDRRSKAREDHLVPFDGQTTTFVTLSASKNCHSSHQRQSIRRTIYMPRVSCVKRNSNGAPQMDGAVVGCGHGARVLPWSTRASMRDTHNRLTRTQPPLTTNLSMIRGGVGDPRPAQATHCSRCCRLYSRATPPTAS
jgi:hypothetical protein